MNRKILALILALAALAAAVALAVSMNSDTPGVTEPDAGTRETTPSVPAVEDSIFDLEDTIPYQTEQNASEPETQPDSKETPETVPVDPDQDVPGYTRPVSTEPVANEPQQPSEPAETQPAATEPVEVPEGEIDYETFTAMTPTQQRVYMESFESLDAFFEWYNAAKEAYEQAHPPIDVGDGVIDMEDIIG